MYVIFPRLNQLDSLSTRTKSTPLFLAPPLIYHPCQCRASVGAPGTRLPFAGRVPRSGAKNPIFSDITVNFTNTVRSRGRRAAAAEEPAHFKHLAAASSPTQPAAAAPSPPVAATRPGAFPSNPQAPERLPNSSPLLPSRVYCILGGGRPCP